MTDKAKITRAFQELRRKGYVALQNFSCCGSCAAYEIGQRLKDKGIPEPLWKAVHYNRQSNDSFRAHRSWGRRRTELTHDLHSVLYLSWQGDASEIVSILKAQGLDARHDGDDARCIEIHPVEG